MVASYAHDYVGTRNRSHATKTVDIDISLPQKLPTSLQKGFVPNAMLPGSLKSLEADRAAEEAEKQKYEEAARKRDAELQALKEEAQVAQDNSQKRWKEALEKSTETRRKLTTTLKALATNTPFDQLGGLLGSCLSRPLPAWKRVPSGLGFRGLRGHDGNAIPITGGIKDLAGAWFRPTNSCLTKAKPSLAFLRSKGAGSSDEHQTSQLELEPSPQVPCTGLGTDAVRQLARLQQQLRVCLVTSNSDVVQSHSVPAVDERRVALLPPRYYGSVPTHHKLFERRELSYDEEEQREAVREEHQQKVYCSSEKLFCTFLQLSQCKLVFCLDQELRQRSLHAREGFLPQTRKPAPGAQARRSRRPQTVRHRSKDEGQGGRAPRTGTSEVAT